MGIWLFWQIVFAAIAVAFGLLSITPRFLWSNWPRIGMWVSYLISMCFSCMVLVSSINK